MTREAVLREETHKEDGVDIDRRVFYTLHDGAKNNQQAHRNSKAIAVLIKILHEKGILKESDIDDILFEAIN